MHILNKNIIGFTLIEIMIVVIILAVIISTALPTYFTHITKARRTEGQIALLDLATKIERFYAENHTFVGASLANLGSHPDSPNQWYHLRIKNQTTSTFLLQAIPQGDQATRDKTCATLQINQLNQKTITGSGNVAECW